MQIIDDHKNSMVVKLLISRNMFHFSKGLFDISFSLSSAYSFQCKEGTIEFKEEEYPRLWLWHLQHYYPKIVIKQSKHILPDYLFRHVSFS